MSNGLHLMGRHHLFNNGGHTNQHHHFNWYYDIVNQMQMIVFFCLKLMNFNFIASLQSFDDYICFYQNKIYIQFILYLLWYISIQCIASVMLWNDIYSALGLNIYSSGATLVKCYNSCISPCNIFVKLLPKSLVQRLGVYFHPVTMTIRITTSPKKGTRRYPSKLNFSIQYQFNPTV